MAVSKRWQDSAGVGIGTLYRHFPTREALFEAVYRREVEQLGELAEQLMKSEAAPVDALRRWLRSNVEFVATKKGMSAALALAAYRSSELAAYSLDRLTKAVGGLLERAVAAGEIRARYQSGRPSAGAGRHVLYARSARLAGQRPAADGRLRRRIMRTARSQDANDALPVSADRRGQEGVNREPAQSGSRKNGKSRAAGESAPVTSRHPHRS